MAVTDDVAKDLKGRIDRALEDLKRELAKIRTGRASLSLLEGVRVNYYGTPTPLAGVASLAVPEPRLITVKPWEKGLLKDVEKALREANLGLTPMNDGEIIRLPIPALTEERRRELSRVVKRMGEDGKVAIRNLRRDANEMLKEYKASGDITEDNEKTGLKRTQDTTDKGIAKVDEIVAKKEAEIMEV